MIAIADNMEQCDIETGKPCQIKGFFQGYQRLFRKIDSYENSIEILFHNLLSLKGLTKVFNIIKVNTFNSTELILTPEGCLYHVNLRPEHLADNIILVGDPGRVPMVSGFFDEIELKRQNREIITHTGWFKSKRFSVISTGMGPDNIDIVLNELDALVNIDLDKRIPRKELKKLTIIRLGTSGSIQKDLGIDQYVISEFALGLDGLLHFYKMAENVIDEELTGKFLEHYHAPSTMPTPYIIPCSKQLSSLFDNDWHRGITVTAPGFYGPQGRGLRLALSDPGLIDKLNSFQAGNLRILNFEMESSAIYGLCRLMGHECLTICPVLASRVNETYSSNYLPVMKLLIKEVLDKLAKF
jgi:uridine phosphorylase